MGCLLILIVLFSNAAAFLEEFEIEPVVRSGTNGQVCPHGQSVDTIFRNRDYTCKPAPGGEDLTCKDYEIALELPFRCPRNGYIRSYWQDKPDMTRVQCCTKPGLYYSELNCAINQSPFNYTSFKVYTGKVWTGYFSNDGGKTWTNTDCGYKHC